jgi:hypothetical protein
LQTSTKNGAKAEDEFDVVDVVVEVFDVVVEVFSSRVDNDSEVLCSRVNNICQVHAEGYEPLGT